MFFNIQIYFNNISYTLLSFAKTDPVMSSLQIYGTLLSYSLFAFRLFFFYFKSKMFLYVKGYITSQTRNEQAMLNRNKRRKFDSDLRALQMKISSMSGSAKTRNNECLRESRGDDEKLFESQVKDAHGIQCKINALKTYLIIILDNICKLIPV